MVVMSTQSGFVETLHPRGQAGNAGQFRKKENDAPAATLTDPKPDLSSEFGAVTATIVFQELDHRDNDREVGREAVDIAAILDGRDVDDLPDSAGDYETIDGLFHWAQNMGLIGEHNGPFEVHLDDAELEAYRAARLRKGRVSALRVLRTCTAADLKERYNTALQAQLPAGGISEIMAWDDDAAAKWIGETRTALVQQAAQGRIQFGFLDSDDARMHAEIDEAALAAHLTSRDTEKIRTTALRTLEHLGRTQW